MLAVQEALEVSAEPAVLDALVAPAGQVVLAVELELRPVQAPLELVRLAALAQRLQRAPRVAPRKTKSVTAAHHRGLAPVPTKAEALAAVVETMRAPAATEAARVWEAAD